MHRVTAGAMATVGLLVTLGMATQARAVWEVDGRGECVHHWTPASLLRGPTALLNALLAPMRSLAGGIVNSSRVWKTVKPPAGVITVPAMVGFSGAVGMSETVIWALGGAADTVTGGRFEYAPVPATELSLSPMTPPYMETAVAPAKDRCGRPVSK